jgi:hypothetical protein
LKLPVQEKHESAGKEGKENILKRIAGSKGSSLKILGKRKNK